MKKTITFFAAMASALISVAQPKPGSFEQTWKKGPQWLENAVIYQIYPSSYKDSDGNGIGDIPGVMSKLDYIEKLGVNVIWFNPLFVSGWIDGGYDVIDFYKVDPRFGTNTDLVNLISECHKRGIKVFLDLVPGHTSDQHPWFKQSMEADANQRYSDYFIWSDRLPDKRAEDDLKKMLASDNVMQNTIGKWMKSDAPRGKYYMKNFYACQPALNFGYYNPNPANPWEQGMDAPGPKAVKQEMKNIIEFWFNKGVDGFRVDMAASLIKNDKDKKGIIEFWREIRGWMDTEFPDHVLMAEWGNPKYCLAAGFNIDMDLNGTSTKIRRMYFDKKHQADGGSYFSLNGGQPSMKDLYGNPWPEDKIDTKEDAAKMLKRFYDEYSDNIAWTKDWGYYANLTGNHDHLRFNMGARNTPDQLKVSMAWIMTMQLPILYYGDEIGIRSLAALPNVEGADHNGKERTGGRSPMQWDGSVNAGFSTCNPSDIYIPVCPEWTPATSYPLYLKWKEDGCKNPTAKGEITVASQDNDPESLLNWTRALIKLRKETKAFWSSCEWKPIYNEDVPYPMVYTRTDGTETYLVALNPTGVKRTVTIPSQTSEKAGKKLSPVLMTGKASYKVTAKGDVLTMQPTSAMIVKVNRDN